MNKKKLLLIGNGMAGVSTIEHILKVVGNRFDITIIGSEPYPNYNRILLSSLLAGTEEMKNIIIHNWDWYKEHQITLHTGCKAIKIDPSAKKVMTDTQGIIPYDELIIATGSLPFQLPIPGGEKDGIVSFRNIQDCETMIDLSKKFKKAAVIGGGLLGLEAAKGLLQLGMEVSVVHLMDYLMERQLDATAAKLLQRELERQGINFYLNKQTDEILGNRHVTGLRFKDGSEIEADVVVMAVGIRPNVELAKSSGIDVQRGIVVNDYMQTNHPHIYAVGECAEHRGIVYGLVAPLFEQGAVLAKHLCGMDTKPYQGSVVATKLKVSGIQVYSAGEFMDQNETMSVLLQDCWQGIYKKLLLKENRIIGGILVGDTTLSARISQWIKNQKEMTSEIHTEFMSISTSGTSDSHSSVLGMAEDEIICGCNGVSKGTIVNGIREKGLKNIDEVKACTNASRSCGGCKPQVAQLLESILGEKVREKETICPCTNHGRDQVVETIREKHLTHMREVMRVLGWNTEEGCPKCRPALNYYLGMIWPEEYVDELESRFVNERIHANIQKDGTYSVVPRMYGGVTTPTELKRVAEVAEKYKVPIVKVTGGQRIDLLGVKKEDLPSLWSDLKMPSGSAYAKAIRTVKTCVGKDFCRFGTQNSIQMGIRMEKEFERLNTPAKVKMAVSACPRNCAESGIKDLGVVGVEGGWEIYVGGNGGVQVRKGDLFCKVVTSDEVLEITGAYLQYYRETGRYGERTSQWVERIGLDRIRQAVVDDVDLRKALFKKVKIALSQLKDPWQEIISDERVRKTIFEEIKMESLN